MWVVGVVCVVCVWELSMYVCLGRVNVGIVNHES